MDELEWGSNPDSCISDIKSQVPEVRSRRPAAPEAIERDGRDDDGADDDVLGGIGNPGVDATVVQDGHDQATDQGPQDRPLAAVEAPAADDDGGDDLQLQPLGGRRV